MLLLYLSFLICWLLIGLGLCLFRTVDLDVDFVHDFLGLFFQPSQVLHFGLPVFVLFDEYNIFLFFLAIVYGLLLLRFSLMVAFHSALATFVEVVDCR